MDNKIYISDGLLCREAKVESSTVNPPSPFEDIESMVAVYTAADVMVMCAICKEHTSMNSMDYRAHGVFICDKCRNAIMHIRELLENGESIV